MEENGRDGAGLHLRAEDGTGRVLRDSATITPSSIGPFGDSDPEPFGDMNRDVSRDGMYRDSMDPDVSRDMNQ